nr:hypothetical protein Iba_chr02aCG12490 [Ipomoea batatas]
MRRAPETLNLCPNFRLQICLRIQRSDFDSSSGGLSLSRVGESGSETAAETLVRRQRWEQWRREAFLAAEAGVTETWSFAVKECPSGRRRRRLEASPTGASPFGRGQMATSTPAWVDGGVDRRRWQDWQRRVLSSAEEKEA